MLTGRVRVLPICQFSWDRSVYYCFPGCSSYSRRGAQRPVVLPTSRRFARSQRGSRESGSCNAPCQNSCRSAFHLWRCASALFVLELTNIHGKVLYAIGLVYLDIESTSAVVLLSFVMPLAFTLSGFLLWIMHALGATVKELQQRKQRYKLRMFKNLQRILIGALAIIVAFFVLSSMSFSDRLSEGVLFIHGYPFIQQLIDFLLRN